VDIQELQAEVRLFAEDREWEQFHTLRNLTLALVGEVGELAEVIQWAGEITAEQLRQEHDLARRFSEEVADVFIYLLRLADVAGIDLPTTITAKIALNAHKYPVEEVRGSSQKR